MPFGACCTVCEVLSLIISSGASGAAGHHWPRTVLSVLILPHSPLGFLCLRIVRWLPSCRVRRNAEQLVRSNWKKDAAGIVFGEMLNEIMLCNANDAFDEASVVRLLLFRVNYFFLGKHWSDQGYLCFSRWFNPVNVWRMLLTWYCIICW